MILHTETAGSRQSKGVQTFLCQYTDHIQKEIGNTSFIHFIYFGSCVFGDEVFYVCFSYPIDGFFKHASVGGFSLEVGQINRLLKTPTFEYKKTVRLSGISTWNFKAKQF